MGFSVEEEDENDSAQNDSDPEEIEDQKQPLKLHRRLVPAQVTAKLRRSFHFLIFRFCFRIRNRDTPHHLKNKRVQHGGIDKAAANILLANTLRQVEPDHVIEEPHGISDVNAYESEPLNETGEWQPIDLFNAIRCENRRRDSEIWVHKSFNESWLCWLKATRQQIELRKLFENRVCTLIAHSIHKRPNCEAEKMRWNEMK